MYKQADRGHLALDAPAEGARQDLDVLARMVGPGEEQHESGEQVAQRLLCGDADDHTGHGTADEQMTDRDREQIEPDE